MLADKARDKQIDPILPFHAGGASLCGPEGTKIARFSVVAAAIFTAPGKIARLFETPRCAISSAKRILQDTKEYQNQRGT